MGEICADWACARAGNRPISRVMTELAHLPLDALALPDRARPKMPPIPRATEQHRRNGRQLAAIHRHYLMEMSRVAAVLDRIAAGDAPPEDLAAIILSTDMRRNLEAAGTICGHQCQVLTIHHNIEEFSMFPELEQQGNDALTALVAQLRKEHKVVHELLIRLEAAARTLIDAPTDANFETAHATFRQLRTVVISHFGYEEQEIAEAIGYYLNGI